eukprot:8866227-Alexandrium_andersonii.AAC.1
MAIVVTTGLCMHLERALGTCAVGLNCMCTRPNCTCVRPRTRKYSSAARRLCLQSFKWSK